ncbi:MAG: mechanosensitive ion channel family protein [Erysipelotrichaceae bacterium]|nr:mechanosensitive ion channel family protein [Erysipelotrichaceae bacterium]
MKDVLEVLEYFISPTFYFSLLVLAVTWVLMYFIKQYLIKKVAYTTKGEQHSNTFAGVFFSILQYLVIIIAAIVIMKLHGINVTSILAGLGIVATIVGLALQDTLKDIFAGINIFNNNYYKVGDMVRYNNEECDVKYFNARITKFQSLRTNSTYTVNNSMIHSIEKIKDRGIQTFHFPFDLEKEKVDACMEAICERMRNECANLKEIFYDGMKDINTSGVEYELKYACPAHKSEKVKDTLALICYEEFKKAGIKPIFSRSYM